MLWVTRLLAAGFISACVWQTDACAQGEGGAPARIASADLCADAWVIELASQDSVIALSWQVDSPVSAAPGWARALPRAWGDAERLIALDPDLAVFGPGGPGRALPVLDASGIDTLTLPWGEDFAAIRASARTAGAALGREAGAEVWIADLDARLEALSGRAEARGWSPSVFYLSVTGGTAGDGTLIDAAIRAAGGRNAASEAGAAGWTQSDAEWALRVAPDLVVTSYFTDGYRTAGNAGQRHAAFRRLVEHHPSIEVPGALWSCAGPGLIEAAERIADALDELTPEGEG
ncbi:ABC transporter substrate-binding protein [Hyphobacterium sp. SN044]|uniref:ABC transporter substrate-binding protein n=1 Tax=Hyphobacterium sp. SN044 TaxID=2912575 RepID=UPI001F403B5C|nr:ABC transporter substrate-binding protein [Hyphobacterium sp. SN044]MCF8879948.1 ABC transporter substrate-binding protein [Hyphobacterium sp. SN044]